MTIARILFIVALISPLPANEIAARNGKLASEALERSRRTMHAWLRRTDAVTGLLPRRGNDPNWVVKDSAADLYPFLVMAARYLEPHLYRTTMRDILRQETLLASRVGRLPDDLRPGGGFVFPEVDLEQVIFGASEYAKDGLLPLTELLGDTPWYYRMRGIADDLARHAPYSTNEVNGNMLQVFSRLHWKTGRAEYLAAALAIADRYFLDRLPKTGYLPGEPQFVFSDHGNEIGGGLSEIYYLLLHRYPEKARPYREPFRRMIDRLLEVGRNPDGVWISRYDGAENKVVDARPAHCWGYLFNAVYTAFLATGEERYRKAVEQAIEGVTRNSRYLFDPDGAGRGWGSNAYSDSIEGALVLLNRLPNAAFEQAIDRAIRPYFERQRPDGIVEDWYGDGNFIRTNLMYAFWKTQGTWLEPWSPRVRLGAAREGDRVVLHVQADSSWQGKVRFDHPRHRDHWNMARNYPRLNEWPEWFVVEQDRAYRVQVGEGVPRRYLGADLVGGLPLALEIGEKLIVTVE
jgi:hypothetical protein